MMFSNVVIGKSVLKDDSKKSTRLIELIVLIVPLELWIDKHRKTRSTTALKSVAAGFIRLPESSTLHSIRQRITDQLDTELIPEEYTFLRNIGRFLSIVNHSQELSLTAADFCDHKAYSELLLLPGGVRYMEILSSKKTNTDSILAQPLGTGQESFKDYNEDVLANKKTDANNVDNDVTNGKYDNNDDRMTNLIHRSKKIEEQKTLRPGNVTLEDKTRGGFENKEKKKEQKIKGSGYVQKRNNNAEKGEEEDEEEIMKKETLSIEVTTPKTKAEEIKELQEHIALVKAERKTFENKLDENNNKCLEIIDADNIDYWKRRYFTEKRQTAELSKEIWKYKKLIDNKAHTQSNGDDEIENASSEKRLGVEPPSERRNLQNMVTKLQLEIAALDRCYGVTRTRLSKEHALTTIVQEDLKDLRNLDMKDLKILGNRIGKRPLSKIF